MANASVFPTTGVLKPCACNTDEMDFKYGELSFGTIWEPEFTQKVTCRPHSVFIGAGLYLDAIGQVPSNRMYDTYETEEQNA